MKRRTALPLWMACLLVGLAGVLLLQANFLLYSRLAGPFTRNDFGHLYLGAAAVAEGADPYDPRVLFRLADAAEDERRVERLNPYVYPPLLAVVLRPLAWFSFDDAFGIWTAFNVLLFGVATALLPLVVPELRRRWQITAFAAVLIAFFYPLYRSFSAGQLNVVVLAVVVGAYAALSRNRQGWAGAILALGAMLKILPGVLLFYLLARRAWRGAISFAVTFAALGVLTVALVGWETTLAFGRVSREMSYGRSTWSQLGQHYHVDPFNESWAALAYRALTHNPVTQGWADAPAAAALVAYGGLLLLVAFAGMRTVELRTEPVGFSRAGFGLWVLVMLLAPSLCWDHYFVIALPVYLFAAADGLARKHRPLLWAGLLAALVAAWPYAYSAQDPTLRGLAEMMGLAAPADLHRGPAIVLLSPKLLATLPLLAALGLAVDRPRLRVDPRPPPTGGEGD